MTKLFLITSEFTFYSAATSRIYNWCYASLVNDRPVMVWDIKANSLKSFNSIEELETNYKALLSKDAIYRGQSNLKSSRVMRRLKYLLHLDIIPLSMNVYRRLLSVKRFLDNETKILVSSPSPEVLLIGLLLTKRCSALIVDFRDQWYGHPLLPFSRGIVRRSVLGFLSIRAKKVVTVSEFIAEKLTASLKREVDIIYNTVSCFREVKPIKSTILEETVVYSGSLPENYFNLDLLYEVISESDLKFHWKFYGQNSNFKSRIGKGMNVSFLGYQKPGIVQMAQEGAGFNLFVGADFERNAGIITTKIWEYILAGRPILCFDVKEKSDVRTILENYCQKGDSPINGMECFYPRTLDKDHLLKPFIKYV